MKALDGLRSIFCHATTNQKHAGMTEGEWDRSRNRARTLGERDGNDEPLAEGKEDNNNKYSKDGDISDDDDKYAVAVNGISEPLDKGDNQRCPRTSMPCESAAECALMLRASYSQWATLRV
jgi:hypothetical protein